MSRTAPMLRSIARHLSLVALLAVPPLGGGLLAGEPLAGYFRFPPDPTLGQMTAFSPPLFTVLAILTFLLLAGVARLAWAAPATDAARRHDNRRHPFPRWGWAGLALTGLSWAVGWGLPESLLPWHALTFFPLWLGYILVMNALAVRRTGHCLLRDRPGFLLALFPLSTLAWWYFELLNNFVHNWHYVGIEGFGPTAQLIQASLAFSTVLPAVLSTRQWLAAHPVLVNHLNRGRAIPLGNPEPWVFLLLGGGLFALAGLALWPRALFPLVWVAPLLIVTAWRMLQGQQTVFNGIRNGDWSRVVLGATAGLVCGLFWELWNWGNPVHWEYTIPYVQRFELFQMPLLGYAGYLPFGLWCLALADLIAAPWRRRPKFQTPPAARRLPVNIQVEYKPPR